MSLFQDTFGPVLQSAASRFAGAPRIVAGDQDKWPVATPTAPPERGGTETGSAKTEKTGSERVADILASPFGISSDEVDARNDSGKSDFLGRGAVMLLGFGLIMAGAIIGLLGSQTGRSSAELLFDLRTSGALGRIAKKGIGGKGKSVEDYPGFKNIMNSESKGG